MVKTYSQMLPLGTVAPDFSLPDALTGSVVRLSSLPMTTATVIFFICNHCPYVKHINAALVDIVREFSETSVQWIGINANDASQYPEDSFEHMHEAAQQLGYNFPYLYDETQEVAAAYHAACTPDFFVFNDQHQLVYRGQFDDSRPGQSHPATGEAIRTALQALLTGQPITLVQKPSLGCNIKWKKQYAFS